MACKEEEKAALEASTLEELVKSLPWSDDAAEEIFRRASAGDSEARKVALKSLRKFHIPCEFSPETFEKLKDLQWETDDDPGRGLAKVRELMKSDLAPCELGQAHGIEAQALRMLNDYVGAKAAISRAWSVAGFCDLSVPDLELRSMWPAYHDGRIEEAIRHADTAVKGYKLLDGPGHDLDGEGLAVSMMNRGELYYLTGSYEAAAVDLGEAVALIHPSNRLLATAIFNLAVALERLGSAERRRAYQDVLVCRAAFMRRGRTVPRAKLDWLEGSLRVQLSENPKRGRKLLRRGLTDLIHFEIPYDAAALAADIMRVLFPDRHRIVGFLDEKKPRILRLVRAILPLVEALDGVSAAAWGVDPQALDRAIASLREACGPRVLPCLVVNQPR